jgi:hypothetical protein
MNYRVDSITVAAYRQAAEAELDALMPSILSKAFAGEL